MFVIDAENLKKLKYHIVLKYIKSLIVYSYCGHEYKTIFKEEESIEILKIIGLTNNIGEYQKIYNHA